MCSTNYGAEEFQFKDTKKPFLIYQQISYLASNDCLGMIDGLQPKFDFLHI